jgi:hypothetical protein
LTASTGFDGHLSAELASLIQASVGRLFPFIVDPAPI